MKIVLFTLTALLFSCSMKSKSNELQDKFADLIIQKHSSLKNGKQLLFIINKPECSPCIEAMQETIAEDYDAVKNAIHFGNAPFAIPQNVMLLKEDEHTIAQYGMLGVDGTICIFSDGLLTEAFPFNTREPSKTIQLIKNTLKENHAVSNSPSSFRYGH